MKLELHLCINLRSAEQSIAVLPIKKKRSAMGDEETNVLN